LLDYKFSLYREDLNNIKFIQLGLSRWEVDSMGLTGTYCLYIWYDIFVNCNWVDTRWQ